MSITLLGVFAWLLTSCSFIPQAYKVIKTKRTQDISLPMYSLLTIECLSGFIHWNPVECIGCSFNQYHYFCTDMHHSHPDP